jgi:hypothetical protein
MTQREASQLNRFRTEIADAFKEGELELLAFDMGIDWEEIRGETKSEKIQALIEYCHNRGKMPALVAAFTHARPHKNWSVIVPPSLLEETVNSAEIESQSRPFYLNPKLIFVNAIIAWLLVFFISFVLQPAATAATQENLVGAELGGAARSSDQTESETFAPTFAILKVVPGESITIQTQNFPANETFLVTMGLLGTAGIDGIPVDEVNSGRGGTFEKTFPIPPQLKGEPAISVRLQTVDSLTYYAQNFFENSDVGDETEQPPLIEEIEEDGQELPRLLYEWPEKMNPEGSNYKLTARFENIDAPRQITPPETSGETTDTTQISNPIPFGFGTPEASLKQAYAPDYYLRCTKVNLANTNFVYTQLKPDNCYDPDDPILVIMDPKEGIAEKLHEIDVQFDVEYHPASPSGPNIIISEAILITTLPIEVTRTSQSPRQNPLIFSFFVATLSAFFVAGLTWVLQWFLQKQVGTAVVGA